MAFFRQALQWRCVNTILFFLFTFQVTYVDAISGSVYHLDTEYSGPNFFDGWDFSTGSDPTHGFVNYYNQSYANTTGLIKSKGLLPTYIGVDHSNVLSTQDTGRGSVRITTQKSWTHGLFIGDFRHIPAGACGTWPAFWSFGPNWPTSGEIDIMEGVSDNAANAVSFHTSSTCDMKNNEFQSGKQGARDCSVDTGGSNGCGVGDQDANSYSNFNNVGGGVYAMQWTSVYIRVWFWRRSYIPEDITVGTPNPSYWGMPVANLDKSGCPIDQHFQQHSLVLDTTFCGDYAGSVWPGSSCQTKTGYPTCAAYVAATPQDFEGTFWSINSIRVYKLVDLSPTSSATTQPLSSTTQGSPFSSVVTSTTTPVTFAPVTYVPPTVSITTVSGGVTTVVTSSSIDSLTHPIFNTTSGSGTAIGPAMGGSTNPTISATSQGTTSATRSSTPRPTVGKFGHLGCRGLSRRTSYFQLVQQSIRMTTELCLRDCAGRLAAAVNGRYCFCADRVAAIDNLIKYSPQTCSIRCPGNLLESCGGLLRTNHNKRMPVLPPANWAYDVYYNAIYPTGIASTTTSRKTSAPVFQLAPVHKLNREMAVDDAANIATATTRTTLTTTIHWFAISTIWTDYCQTCVDYQTTRSTTITLSHCACTIANGNSGCPEATMTPLPSIPMTTVDRDCACGMSGSPSTTVVIIPNEPSISAMRKVFAAAAVLKIRAAPTAVPTTFLQMPASSLIAVASPTLSLSSIVTTTSILTPVALENFLRVAGITGPVIPIPAPATVVILSTTTIWPNINATAGNNTVMASRIPSSSSLKASAAPLSNAGSRILARNTYYMPSILMLGLLLGHTPSIILPEILAC